MVLDMAAFTPLRVPAWVNVPSGALNHTSVMRDRNSLLLRSRCTEPLNAQMAQLRSDDSVVDFELGQEPQPDH